MEWRLLVVSVLANARGAALAIFYLTDLRVGVARVVILAIPSYDPAGRISTSGDPSRLLQALYQLDLLGVGASILATIVLARSVATAVVEPLEQLGRQFERVRRGDLEGWVPVTSNDEK